MWHIQSASGRGFPFSGQYMRFPLVVTTLPGVPEAEMEDSMVPFLSPSCPSAAESPGVLLDGSMRWCEKGVAQLAERGESSKRLRLLQTFACSSCPACASFKMHSNCPFLSLHAVFTAGGDGSGHTASCASCKVLRLLAAVRGASVTNEFAWCKKVISSKNRVYYSFVLCNGT